MINYYIEKNLNDENIKDIVDGVKGGKLIAFPTETVYGIGANGFDIEAINKLFKIKNRPFSKPISLMVSNFNMINMLTKNINEIEKKIIYKFLPGPLTILLEKNDKVPDILTANSKYIGIRMPLHNTSLKIIDRAGVPFAVTSANISGEEDCIDFEKVLSKFNKDIDFFIDGGKSKIGIPSTVVKVENGDIKILREGSISKDFILSEIS